ncbi:F-box protein At2g26850 [Selaginella moellendorffii]|nr:F-box protein At2g26850 [Selaginella moellendorffii]|eukprot:XP_002968595.2 F-box protein At2g26850 [Selaginella moellendorffii]
MGRGERQASIGLSSPAWASRSLRRIHAAVAAATAATMAFLIKRPRVLHQSGLPEGDFHGDSCPSSSSTSILDLPDLALDDILSRLPADSLLRLGGVCQELRQRCKSGHFWESLVYEKWGEIAGPGAYREWCRNPVLESSPRKGRTAQEIAAKNACERPNCGWKLLWPSIAAACLWPLSVARERLMALRSKAPRPSDSLMAWYWALETGNLWFRGQVFNRENGHVGFLLSCYDAELSYVRSSDSFRARYPPHGPRALVMEDDISWERVRASPVQTPAHDLHTSDCLAELRPGDHIEVQWRRTKEFPYGWWYGIVGHSDSCSNAGNNSSRQHCSCQSDNTVWLVFNQFTSGSRWKRTPIDRVSHREEGNETDGYYGGIRKLRSKDEISMWERLWPVDILE